MTETYGLAQRFRVNGKNPASSTSCVRPVRSVVVPDAVAVNPASYARSGSSFLAQRNDGALRWYRIAQGAGGPGGEVVIEPAGNG